MVLFPFAPFASIVPDRGGRNRKVLPFASIASMTPELVALCAANFGQSANFLRESRRVESVATGAEKKTEPQVGTGIRRTTHGRTAYTPGSADVDFRVNYRFCRLRRTIVVFRTGVRILGNVTAR